MDSKIYESRRISQSVLKTLRLIKKIEEKNKQRHIDNINIYNNIQKQKHELDEYNYNRINEVLREIRRKENLRHRNDFELHTVSPERALELSKQIDELNIASK